MSSDENSKSNHLEGGKSEEDKSTKKEQEEISEDENKTETKVVKSEETLEETIDDESEEDRSKSVRRRRKGRSKKEKHENTTLEGVEEKNEENPNDDVEEGSKSVKRKGKLKKKKRSRKEKPENATVEENEEENDEEEKMENEKSDGKGGRGKWFKRKFRSKKDKHEDTTVEESEEKNDENENEKPDDDEEDDDDEDDKEKSNSKKKSFSERLREKKQKLWGKSKSESVEEHEGEEEEEGDKEEESTQSHSRVEKDEEKKKTSRLGLLVSKRFKSSKNSADTTMESKEYSDDEEQGNDSKDDDDESGVPSEEYSLEEEPSVEEKQKRKKKSKKDREDESEERSEEEHEPPVKEKKKRKKKSKKERELPRPQPRASATDVEGRGEESYDDDGEETRSYEGETRSVEMQDSVTYDDTVEEPKEKPRKRRRKRRKKKERRQDVEENAQQVENNVDTRDEDVVTSSSVEVTRKRRKDGHGHDDEEQLFGVTIHGSEYLKSDLIFLTHPLVRISIVDPSTGLYLQKTTPDSNGVAYIEPVLTKTFDFTEKKSISPRWEETLVFNKTIRDLVRGTRKAGLEESPVMFFVVRDFSSMSKTRTDKRSEDMKGWHTCAWAFLKLIGTNGEANIDRQCRLQLFRPPPYKKYLEAASDPTLDPVFAWWSQPRIPYKSTLFVTIQSIPAKHVKLGMGDASDAPTFDPKTLLASKSEANIIKPLKDCYTIEEMRLKVKWTKHPEQDCKVPNTQLMQLWAGSHGAFTIKFSNHGYLLAVGCRHGATFPVLVYNIPFGNLCGELCGHQELVYDIDWSQDDDLILTASGDGTAQVWKMDRGREPLCTLSHPAYVYAARFHEFAQHIVVTAGYDKIVRVWSIAKSSGRLLQELEGHTYFINTLSFDKSGLTLYTGDNGGVILCWATPTSDNPSIEKVNWSLKKRIEENALQNFGINKIETNPRNDRKLLLSCKNTTTKMMDARISGFVSYEGVSTDGQLIRSTMSPCGTFVVSGNQDGRAYVWNTETGGQVASYDELDFVKAVRDVDWHRHEHMIALCSFHSNAPVYVYIYSTKAAADGVKLGRFHEETGHILEDQEKEGRFFEARDQELSSKIDIVKQQLDNIVFGQEAAPARKKMKSVADDVTKMASSVKAFEESLKGGTSLMSPSKLLRDEPCVSRQKFVQPAFLSPHATAGARAIGDSFKLDLQNTIQPRFTPIGKSMNMKEDTLKNLTLSISKKGNESADSNLVLVLYDYEANRSDELTIKRNDILKVLFRDGPKWWFGENTAGAQGYFPSSYVTTTDEKSDLGEFENLRHENGENSVEKIKKFVEGSGVDDLSPRVLPSTPRSITEPKIERTTTLELSTPAASSRGRRRDKRNKTNNETMQKSVLFEPQQQLQEEPQQKEEIQPPPPQPARPLPPLVMEEKPKLRKREKTPRKKKKSKSRSPSRKDHQQIETPPKSSSPDEPRRKVPSPPKKRTNTTTASSSSAEFGILKAIQEKLRQAESPERDGRQTVASLDDDVINTPLLSSTVRSKSRLKRHEQRSQSSRRKTSFDTRVQSAFNNEAFDSSEA